VDWAIVPATGTVTIVIISFYAIINNADKLCILQVRNLTNAGINRGNGTPLTFVSSADSTLILRAVPSSQRSNRVDVIWFNEFCGLG